jgi:hypothetical protein
MTWIFAEERSGSCWLARMLNAEHTHEFELLAGMNEFVIRTARRDQYEQFLSFRFMMERKKDGWRHPHISFPKSVGKFQEMLNLPPITVTKEQVDEWKRWQIERNDQWSNYQGQKQTIYYEELFEGVAIPELNISYISFKQGGEFQKLPYNKEEHFTNTKQVREWLVEE